MVHLRNSAITSESQNHCTVQSHMLGCTQIRSNPQQIPKQTIPVSSTASQELDEAVCAKGAAIAARTHKEDCDFLLHKAASPLLYRQLRKYAFGMVIFHFQSRSVDGQEFRRR